MPNFRLQLFRFLKMYSFLLKLYSECFNFFLLYICDGKNTYTHTHTCIYAATKQRIDQYLMSQALDTQILTLTIG